MNLTLPHQTLLVTVGPSLSGKSTAAEAIQNLVNAKYDHTRGEACAVVSSDDSRRQLLGNGAHKYDTEMIHASEQAFELLHEKVDRLMRYPIAKPLIIVDSTALNESFRVRLRKQAEAHGYEQKALIFDYDLEDYPGDVSEVTKRHRRKMKRQMGDITTSHWSAGTYKITDPEDLAVTGVTIEGMETKEARYVDEPEDRAFLIGDVHGCYEELLELLDKNGYEIEEESFVADIKEETREYQVPILSHPDDLPIVHTGDLVDKNSDDDVLKTMRLVCWNLSTEGGLWHNVYGNHLDWCVRYAQGDITGVEDHKHLFDSADLISEDTEARMLAEAIYDASESVLYGEHWVCTHAPSRNDQLESIDERMHTRFRYPFRSDFDSDRQYKTALAETFSYVGQDANGCLPYHVFGHVTVPDAPYQNRNKVAVDGGCADGGELAGVIVNGPYSLYKTSVASRQDGEGPRFNAFDAEVRTFENLPGHQKGRAEHLAKEERQFLAPTMSPAPKGEDRGERRLESLEQAIDFFDGEVHVQPKYMGSRLQAYVRFDGEHTFSTRRGFPYDGFPQNMPEVRETLSTTLHDRGIDVENVQMVVLDGELMPWAELGHGLIDQQFGPVESGVNSELFAKETTGFEETLQSYLDSDARETYLEMRHEADKAEIKDEIGSKVYETMQALDRYLASIYVSTDDIKKGLSAYEDQLGKHAYVDEEPTFQPFDVLKIVFEDGSQTIPDWPTPELYRAARPQQKYEPVIVPDGTKNMSAVWDLWDRLRKDDMEGVVVKPLTGFRDDSPNALKVRTPEYLTLAYGPKYFGRFDDLYESRYVGHKIRVSKEETELARELLSYRPDQVGSSSYLNCLAAWFDCEDKEDELDPTL